MCLVFALAAQRTRLVELGLRREDDDVLLVSPVTGGPHQVRQLVQALHDAQGAFASVRSVKK